MDGKFEDSMKIIDEVLNMKIELPNKLYASLNTIKGINLMEMERLDEAIDCFKEAVDVNPDVDLIMFLADALRSAGRNEEAEEAFRDAFQEDPTVLGLNTNYGAFLDEQGRTGEAIPYFRHEIDINNGEKDHNATHILSGAHLNLGSAILKYYGDKLFVNPDAYEEAVSSFFSAPGIDKCATAEAADSLYSVVEYNFQENRFKEGIEVLVRMLRGKFFDEKQTAQINSILAEFKAGKALSRASLPEMKFAKTNFHDEEEEGFEEEEAEVSQASPHNVRGTVDKNARVSK